MSLPIQEKKLKIDFQVWQPSCIPMGTISASFDLQVTSMILTKFQVNWPFGSGEAAKIDFQAGHHGGHLGFSIRTILAIFDLPVTPMLLTKFRVNWPFGSGEEAIKIFSRWPPWQPSWISNQNNFSNFRLTNHHKASYPGSSQ